MKGITKCPSRNINELTLTNITKVTIGPKRTIPNQTFTLPVWSQYDLGEKVLISQCPTDVAHHVFIIPTRNIVKKRGDQLICQAMVVNTSDEEITTMMRGDLENPEDYEDWEIPTNITKDWINKLEKVNWMRTVINLSLIHI